VQPAHEIAVALDKLQADKGLDIDIHVDGASRGFGVLVDPRPVTAPPLRTVPSLRAGPRRRPLMCEGSTVIRSPELGR
jgi:hypothetical protein